VTIPLALQTPRQKFRDYQARPSLDVRNELVERFLPIVDRLADHYAIKTPHPRDDLEQAGALGLLRAVERYDPERKTPFIRFAVKRVRGAMLDELRRADPRGRTLRTHSTDRAGAEVELMIELGRPATDDEVIDRLGWSHEVLLTSIGADAIKDAPARGGSPTVEFVEGDLDNLVAARPCPTMTRREQFADVVDLSRGIGFEDRLLVVLYSLGGHTQVELAAIIGVDPARVSQILTRAHRDLGRQVMRRRRLATPAD